MNEFFYQFGEKVVNEIPNILTAIAIFMVSLLLARLLSNLLNRILKQQKADREVTILLSRLTRWSIIVIGIISALQRFFDVTAFLAGLGILGFTVGFALQDIMQNFVAGIILLVQQPFEVGDVIETDQFLGSVEEISLRTTEMETIDGRIAIIPNATILANPITNYTRSKFRRIELPVGISYDADPAVARQVVLEAIRHVPGFVPDPEPTVVFHTFGGSSLDMSAYFWADMSKTNPILAKDAAFELIKIALDKKGIEIPFPITMVIMEKD
ncbi:MAG: small-conductance mechanosensitive channel MscS [Anaerolineales bacterium]